MEKPTEEQLVAAALALGQATASLSEAEKAQIKSLYEKVQVFAATQKEKGVTIDRSAFFAAGIVLHTDLTDQGLKDAAIKYIDLDLLFVRDKA